jgi:hypothetical protein
VHLQAAPVMFSPESSTMAALSITAGLWAKRFHIVSRIIMQGHAEYHLDGTFDEQLGASVVERG